MLRCGLLLVPLFFLASINGVPINSTTSAIQKCPNMLEYFEGTGFCYGYPGEGGGSLSFAEEICNKIGGHVPSIHSEAEYKFLKNLRKEYGRDFYIGLRREGLTRTWIDGTPNDYKVYLQPDTTCWFQNECCYVLTDNGVHSRHCNEGSVYIRCKVPALF